MGPHHQRKKDGSNSNSSRTSPSKLEDSEFVKNSLLALEDEGLQLPCILIFIAFPYQYKLFIVVTY